jgi:hypothetical protein
VPPNKGRTYPAEVIPREEVIRLLGACSSRAPTGIRNKALVTVMYRAGLRISEALNLMPRDVDAKAGTITIMNGKGGKRRVVGLDPEAFSALARWIDRREQLGINGHARLFCTLEGQPLLAPYVRQALARLAKRARIDRRVNPHALRHSFAAEMAREGKPMNLIQQALGHSSLGTTSRYLAHINPQEVVDAMRGREWGLEKDRRADPSLRDLVHRPASRRTRGSSTAREGDWKGDHDLPIGLTPCGCNWQKVVHLVGNEDDWPTDWTAACRLWCDPEARTHPYHSNCTLPICQICRDELEDPNAEGLQKQEEG